MRILDLTRLLPGAFATALLADLGADVVKVEQPGAGDPMRAYAPRIDGTSAYSWVADRNKRSVALDLRDPRGAAALLRLAAGADVLLESFRPGVAGRLGVGPDAVRAANPALVLASLTGYGTGGPLAQAAGHDLNYAGRAGALGAVPAVPGTQVADLGGALFGVAGLLAALVRARTTGEGDHVQVSLAEAAFALMVVPVAEELSGAGESGLLAGTIPCYNVFACADGRHLTVGALEERFWTELCEGVGRPDLLPTRADPDAVATWRELNEVW